MAAKEVHAVPWQDGLRRATFIYIYYGLDATEI